MKLFDDNETVIQLRKLSRRDVVPDEAIIQMKLVDTNKTFDPNKKKRVDNY